MKIAPPDARPQMVYSQDPGVGEHALDMLVVARREPFNDSNFRCERVGGFGVSRFRFQHPSMFFTFLLAAILRGRLRPPPGPARSGAERS